MSHPGDTELDRRRFLAGGTAGVAVTMFSAEAPAESPSGLWATAPKPSVLLHDPRISMPAPVQQRLQEQGMHAIALEGDPVWFWRSAAGAPLRDPSATLLGVTGWADLLVFRGLSAETRRHLRYEKLAGGSTFIWLVA